MSRSRKRKKKGPPAGDAGIGAPTEGPAARGVDEAPAPDADGLTAPQGDRPWWKPGVAWIGPAILGVLVLFFLVLHAWAMLPHRADEGIYFYGASRMASGVWPYRDFFHAHPPLHLLPTAILMKLFGSSILVAKSPTFMWAAFQGVAAYVVVTQIDREAVRAKNAPAPTPWIRSAAGLIAALVLLYAESFLKASATDTGIMQASGLIALGALLLTLRRPLAAGVIAGAAPMTLLQTAPAAAMIPLAALLLGRRAATRCFLGAAALPVLLTLIFWMIAGRTFIQQTVLFHLGKVGSDGEGLRQLGFIIFDNFTLFAIGTAGALALALGKRRDRIVGGLAALSIVLTFIAIATRPRVFPFYFQPAFFPAAVLCGWGLVRVLETVWNWHRARTSKHPLPEPGPATLIPLALGLLLLTFFRGPASAMVSSRRAEQIATYKQTYDWVDGPGLGGLNETIRSLLWKDGERVAGTDYNGATQYLWLRSRGMELQPEIVAAVREEAQRNPATMLFGDSTTAPQIALEAGVLIPGELVDTNVQRLRTGNLNMADVLGILEAHPATLVLTAAREGIGSASELQAYLAAKFEVLRTFRGRLGDEYGLWRRR